MVYSARTNKPMEKEEKVVLEVGLETSQNNEEDEELVDFLAPSKDIKKETHNNLYQEEILKQSAQQTTLKTLNAIKIVSPIVSTLLESDKAQQSDEQLSLLFKKIILEISNCAEETCVAIGVDSKKEKNAWVRNVLEKHMAEFVRQSISEDGEIRLNRLKAIIPGILEFSTECAEKEPFDDITPTMLIQLANVRCIMPVMTEAMTHFDFLRDINKDVEPILNLIHKACAKATNKLADDYAQEKNRAQLYYLLMQEAGTLYASCWKAEANRVLKIMDNPSEKIQQSIDKYKTSGGFPLNKVNEDFEMFFNRFVVISQKLTIATKKKNLAGKIKDK